MVAPQFRDFIARAETIVRGTPEESRALRELKPLLKEILDHPEWVPPGAFATRKDRFANNLIYTPRDRVFSINGAVWLPGQSTPVHDHLTWALVGLCDGQERESIYRRLDDGSNPKKALIQKVSERVNQKGHITVLGRSGIHRIDNPSDEPSHSVHIYGLDIGNIERHSYDPLTGEVNTFLSGYCNVLRDLDA